ncbi:MAG: endo-1,4-beta-xylanase [Phycisphaeraceae bacterium]|nr:endo-1,4-beta-xylanase [Phycisphaeraceae bacterium]
MQSRRLAPWITVLTFLVTVPLCAQESSWKAQANARIDQLRKRILRIQITDNAGNPVPHASVKLEQTRKAFPFGAAMSKALLTNESYRRFFKDHFNWAVFENESKWYSTERRAGRITYAQADAMFDWCQANGMPVRGHCLYWAPKKWQPKWLTALDSPDVGKAVEQRMNSAVTHFRNRFVHWDINNEMLHGSFYKDHLGEDIRPWMFKQAHALDPDAILFVNEFNILSADQSFKTVQLDAYMAQIRRLIKQGAPIGGIGIQGHIWNEDILATPHVLTERLDKLATLNLPIWITEFDVAREDASENADILELVYRTIYSHPAVEGITLWAFWSEVSWRGPRAALANKDWSLNAAGKRYEALMAEWSTHVTGTTDENGVLTCHAFPGDYAVTATSGQGMPVNTTTTLGSDTATHTVNMTLTPCQPTEVIQLWPNKIPGNITSEDFEKRSLRNHEVRYSRVCKPSMDLYLPNDTQRPTGAVVICPGGGYGGLAYSHEGIWMAQAFNELGLAAAVVKYRLPDDRVMAERHKRPLQDVQRAMQIMHTNAKAWHIDTDKIGVMGFSAGGHLAASVSTHFKDVLVDTATQDQVKPDFSLLIYPVISFDPNLMHRGTRNNLIGADASEKQTTYYSNEKQVSGDMSPVCLVHASDDRSVKVENSLVFYDALRRHKVPAELTVLDQGGHGFGLRPGTTMNRWFKSVESFLIGHNIIVY